jgi:hypothetical protein
MFEFVFLHQFKLFGSDVEVAIPPLTDLNLCFYFSSHIMS